MPCTRRPAGNITPSVQDRVATPLPRDRGPSQVLFGAHWDDPAEDDFWMFGVQPWLDGVYPAAPYTYPNEHTVRRYVQLGARLEDALFGTKYDALSALSQCSFSQRS
ncbi:hypothetical protein GPECTOR_65g172 [Gonium pectorale]|uniref:Uncharacterized protein n=1 Tax=Gonium pectorale TaxID=33097 RepID=A0A150G400_GONPE|nr:hypothetical protein GPECTOR_65g172 [Gonium pectorale]|eukprot:KXZ44554.1 hypothetical protein GPECTOR_65g172 [Gonium pectorale]